MKLIVFIVSAENVNEMNDSNNVCCICYDFMDASRLGIFVSGNCSHIFHDKCIQEWFRTSNTCPICRCIVMKTNQIDSEQVYDFSDIRSNDEYLRALVYVYGQQTELQELERRQEQEERQRQYDLQGLIQYAKSVQLAFIVLFIIILIIAPLILQSLVDGIECAMFVIVLFQLGLGGACGVALIAITSRNR